MLIKCVIEGQTPLLCNRFHEAAQLKTANGSSAVHIGKQPTPREQAELKVYRDSNGKAIIPSTNVMRAIVDAGAFIKLGKTKVTTAKSSIVPAGVAIQELELPLTPQSFEVDSRAVVIPATGGRVMAHRARFDQWKLSMTLDIDTELFSDKSVRELVDIAGKRVGLGDFRPSRKGPFGRFHVVSWKTV